MSEFFLETFFKRGVNIPNSNLKEIIKISSNDNIVGVDFLMKELFITFEKKRGDYLRFFRLLETKLVKVKENCRNIINYTYRL